MSLLFSDIIPDLGLMVEFYPDSIKVYDLNSNHLLKVKKLVETYISAKKSSKMRYSYTLGKKSITGAYATYNFDLLEETSFVRTNSAHILNIDYKHNEGYFVGLYEFGSFIINNNTLNIVSSCQTDNVSFGVFDFETKFFYIHRIDIGLECWDLKTPIPMNRWTNSATNLLKAMILIKDKKLVIGNKKGEIKFFDQLTGKNLRKHKFFDDSIRQIIFTDNLIVLNNKEKVFKITTDGKLLWKLDLPVDKRTIALSYLNDFLWISFYEGMIFQIDNASGKIIHKFIDLKDEILSPIAIYGKWLLYPSPGYLNWLQIENETIKSHIYLGDSVIRSIKAIKDGVISGDDDGKLIYFKVPMIK